MLNTNARQIYIPHKKMADKKLARQNHNQTSINKKQHDGEIGTMLPKRTYHVDSFNVPMNDKTRLCYMIYLIRIAMFPKQSFSFFCPNIIDNAMNIKRFIL